MKAYKSVDSNISSLNEVVVSGFESERPLVHQAGAISRFWKMNCTVSMRILFLSAFNTKPGIRVEQRAPQAIGYRLEGVL